MSFQPSAFRENPIGQIFWEKIFLELCGGWYLKEILSLPETHRVGFVKPCQMGTHFRKTLYKRKAHSNTKRFASQSATAWALRCDLTTALLCARAALHHTAHSTAASAFASIRCIQFCKHVAARCGYLRLLCVAKHFEISFR